MQAARAQTWTSFSTVDCVHCAAVTGPGAENSTLSQPSPALNERGPVMERQTHKQPITAQCFPCVDKGLYAQTSGGAEGRPLRTVSQGGTTELGFEARAGLCRQRGQGWGGIIQV